MGLNIFCTNTNLHFKPVTPRTFGRIVVYVLQNMHIYIFKGGFHNSHRCNDHQCWYEKSFNTKILLAQPIHMKCLKLFSEFPMFLKILFCHLLAFPCTLNVYFSSNFIWTFSSFGSWSNPQTLPWLCNCHLFHFFRIKHV